MVCLGKVLKGQKKPQTLKNLKQTNKKKPTLIFLMLMVIILGFVRCALLKLFLQSQQTKGGSE